MEVLAVCMEVLAVVYGGTGCCIYRYRCRLEDSVQMIKFTHMTLLPHVLI